MAANIVRATDFLWMHSNTMRCLIKEDLATDGFKFIAEHPQPAIASDQVKIKILAAGICGTDTSIYYSSSNSSIQSELLRYQPSSKQPGRKFRPLIVGHEFCGIVTEIGESAKTLSKASPPALRIEVGDYVAAEAHVPCGLCVPCRNGQEHVCTNVRAKGIHEDGCFAEAIAMPYRNVLLLGKGGNTKLIPPRIGALLDAFGNAVHAVEEANVSGKRVAILGAGPQGLMATMLCRQFGAASIILSERRDTERRFALGTAFGANLCFDVSKGTQQLHDFVSGYINDTNGVDVVLEMAGAAHQDAFRLVRNGGQVILLGIPQKPIASFDIAGGVIWKGVTVKGIFGRKMFSTWQTSLRLLLGDRFGLQQELSKIISQREYPLEKYQEAFESLKQRKELKIVFSPQPQ